MATRKRYLEFGMLLRPSSDGRYAVYLRTRSSGGWETATIRNGNAFLYTQEEINAFFHGVDKGLDKTTNSVRLLGKWTLAPKNSKSKRRIQFRITRQAYSYAYEVVALYGGAEYHVRNGMCDYFETVTGLKLKPNTERIVTFVPARSVAKKASVVARRRRA